MQKPNPILVVLAAGMGSRYGGMKQIEPVGPGGELIIDYSIYDAIKAGFKKVVFVIKEEHRPDFEEAIGNRISEFIDVEYVYQDISCLPDGFSVPPDRAKPWGTAHAVLCCESVLDTSFAVINADDYYGFSAYRLLYDFFASDGAENEYALIGYLLKNTMTDHGTVARGTCEIGENGKLTSVVERTKIEKTATGALSHNEDGTADELSPETVVSMNMWGLKPHIFNDLKSQFAEFLERNADKITKAEFFIPTVVDEYIRADKASVRVLPCAEQWYGVTYRQDRESVVSAVKAMVGAGKYSERLWEGMEHGAKG